MPKIDAATVAEHREQRRAALLAAATDLLREHPGTAPSLGEVGARAGISRSAVYHYFTSREDLLEAVTADTFPRWEGRFNRAFAAATTPLEVIHAYVAENIALVVDGEHALALTLMHVVEGEHLGAQSAQFHKRLAEPLEQALTDAGDPIPAVTAELINAMVLTASRLVESGEDRTEVVDAVMSMVTARLRTN